MTPWDVSYTIDPETLRERPNHPDQMRRAMEEHLEKSAPSYDHRTRVRAFGIAGVYARMLGDYDSALSWLRQAVTLADEHGLRREAFVNRIRLAHVHQWRGEFDLSTAQFNALLQTPLEGFEDFLLQHAGKNAFDQRDYIGAANFFRQALAMREMIGDAELIASSRLALLAAERHL